ncbi:HET-domain-containing protein [Sodiomyces alkalinus F11]|uniref:HET-domain-containing protein n=1 Tax=Sodiomyces alkalinus (strain CBS 110278 / VKM F-3762 / F11) TaxID=1314773 RepID=A0A3N2PX64_SODAK|nr:HET-domain-containing protein [Sodiomyces alkalinus F11]ROT39006.1 HET-domain-containing protein [Sodiomyces alkalinus F11]
MASRCQPCSELTISHLVHLTERDFNGHVFPEEGFYRHHDSFDALERSANDGCDFCQLIIDCFKGSPNIHNTIRWPERWEGQGPSCNMETSMYAAAKRLKNSDVKISINANHVFSWTSLEAVEVFDLLLVQVGPREETPRDEETGREVGFPTLTLSFSVPRDPAVFVDKFRIGRFQLDPDLGSASNFEIANRWLADCRDNHPDCLVNDVRALPTRVIDVGLGSSSSPPERPRLLLSGGKKAEYVALSHCWGGRIATLLTTETQSDFQRGLPVDELPANFHDAIAITRRLGIRYLWIDSLCILQDSKEDWEEESKKMASTYRDATVTISAMASRGSSTGILNPVPDSTKTSAPMPRPVRLRVYPEEEEDDDDDGSHETVKVTVEMKEAEEEDLRLLEMSSPLSSRGWTLQESMLSPRHLFYGTRQIYWRCPRGFQSADGLPHGNVFPTESYADISTVLYSDVLRNPPVKKEAEDTNAVLADYYDLVQGYSHRRLTFPSDKLPAFSGLAQRLHPKLGGDYLAGIWSADSKSGLLWYAETNGCPHVEPYRAPSWSWAVTDQPVCFRGARCPPNPLDMRLLEYAVTPRNGRNPYGEVEAAHIVIEASAKPLVRSRQVVPWGAGSRLPLLGAFHPDEHIVPAGSSSPAVDWITNVYSVVAAEEGTDFLLSICTASAREDVDDPSSSSDGFEIDASAWTEEECMAVLVGTNAGDDPGGESHTFVECLVVVRDPGGDGLYRRVGYVVLHDAKLDWLQEWESQVFKLI